MFDFGNVCVVFKMGVIFMFNVCDVECQESMQYMIVGVDGVVNLGDNDCLIDWVECDFNFDWGFGGNVNGLLVFNCFVFVWYYFVYLLYFMVNMVQYFQIWL